MGDYTVNAGGTVSKSVLKNVAFASMIIDHFFALLFLYYVQKGVITFKWAGDLYRVGRFIGRFAFYIFAYMVADGMKRSSNKLKYIRNLALFAFISEIPFDLVHEGVFFDKDSQNVFFTLALGAISIYIVESLGESKWPAYILCSLVALSAYFLKSDYGMAGVLLILLTYLCIDDYYKMIVLPPIVFIFFHALQWYLKGNGYVFDPLAFFKQLFSSVTGEMLGMISYVLIYFYDGSKGRQLNKWFYYCIYPLHLLIFYFIKLLT